MKKKLSLFITIVALIIFISFPLNNVYADNNLYLGGMPAGFSLNTEGVDVVGFSDVITEKGLISPAKDNGIEKGDVILSINNIKIDTALDIEKSLKNTDNVNIELKRNNEIINIKFDIEKDINGINKLGIFVRNDICGIGTITYIKGKRFASLGHPVMNDNGEIAKINSGTLFNCTITGFNKGIRGKAGELRGVFLKTNPIAIINKNDYNGVYGIITRDFDTTDLKKIETGTANIGNAQIYSTILGQKPNKYDIQIVKTDYITKDRNFVIKITDKDLLNKTSGIIQGMSGSPIVQNDKLVGAVTHVFINDPTRGFGISIKNMIND